MSFGDSTYPSICLPFVHKSVHWKKIKEVVTAAGLGEVDRVDVASKKGPKPFNIVFVHFKSWNDTPEVNELRSNLHTDNTFFGRIDCDDQGHYWKFTKSHVARPQRDTTKPKSKPKSTVESIDALLRKEYASLANIQKRIADLQARRSTLMLDQAIQATDTTDFPPTKQTFKEALTAVDTTDFTTPTKLVQAKPMAPKKRKTKVSRKVSRKVKPIRIPIDEDVTPFAPPAAGGTPPMPPPNACHESPISWADEVEAETEE